MTKQVRRLARATRPGPAGEVVELVTDELAEPGPGEVLVRVAAAALNHSEVLALRGGAYAGAFPLDLGYEGAGTVLTCAEDVELSPGARVCWAPVPASCADYLIAPAAMLVPVPDELDLEIAARLPSAGVTAQLLTRVWPVRGETAVVWGAAGPVGRLLTAFLTEAGTEVIGIASGERTEQPHALGAVRVIDRRSRDVAEAVAEYTSGAGAAAVFDPVGATTYRSSLAMLGNRGCLISFGELSGDLPKIDLMDLIERGLFVTKFGGGGAYLDGTGELAKLAGNTLDLALRRPEVISAGGPRVPLSRVAEAYQAIEAGPTGKVVVLPG